MSACAALKHTFLSKAGSTPSPCTPPSRFDWAGIHPVATAGPDESSAPSTSTEGTDVPTLAPITPTTVQRRPSTRMDAFIGLHLSPVIGSPFPASGPPSTHSTLSTLSYSTVGSPFAHIRNSSMPALPFDSPPPPVPPTHSRTQSSPGHIRVPSTGSFASSATLMSIPFGADTDHVAQGLQSRFPSEVVSFRDISASDASDVGMGEDDPPTEKLQTTIQMLRKAVQVCISFLVLGSSIVRIVVYNVVCVPSLLRRAPNTDCSACSRMGKLVWAMHRFVTDAFHPASVQSRCFPVCECG